MIAQTKSFLLAIVAATVFTAGCGGASDTPVIRPSRLTTPNFDAIQNGMSKVQVMQIIGRWREEVPEKGGSAGKPAGSASLLLQCRWKEDSKQINVTFDRDKVVSKSATGLVSPP